MKLEILCYINENLSVRRYWIISRRALSESVIFTTVKVSELAFYAQWVIGTIVFLLQNLWQSEI